MAAQLDPSLEMDTVEESAESGLDALIRLAS